MSPMADRAGGGRSNPASRAANAGAGAVPPLNSDEDGGDLPSFSETVAEARMIERGAASLPHDPLSLSDRDEFDMGAVEAELGETTFFELQSAARSLDASAPFNTSGGTPMNLSLPKFPSRAKSAVSPVLERQLKEFGRSPDDEDGDDSGGSSMPSSEAEIPTSQSGAATLSSILSSRSRRPNPTGGEGAKSPAQNPPPAKTSPPLPSAQPSSRTPSAQSVPPLPQSRVASPTSSISSSPSVQSSPSPRIFSSSPSTPLPQVPLPQSPSSSNTATYRFRSFDSSDNRAASAPPPSPNGSSSCPPSPPPSAPSSP